MAPKSKDATAAPTITTHHTMAAGGQPSAAHESGEASGSVAGEGAEVALTRPKKLVLRPMHATVTPDESGDSDTSKQEQTVEVAKEPESGGAVPLVLETAAETEAANKLAAKLPKDKIELPLDGIALEAVIEDEPSDKPEPAQASDGVGPDIDVPDEIKDPGESDGATEEVDPNEARAQKAEALMASGKYAVHIHELSHTRKGLVVAIIVSVLVVLVSAYFAIAEGVLDAGVDLPKFW